MGGDHCVEIRVFRVPQHAVAQNAGVAAHRIQPAERGQRGFHTEVGGLGGADGGDGRDGTAALGPDRGHRRLGQRRVDVVDHHGGAGGGERTHGLQPDPLPGPGHHGDLVVQPHHRPPIIDPDTSVHASP